MNTKSEGTGDERRPDEDVDLYGASYGHFTTEVYEDVRAETYGTDIGQTGWLTAEEQNSFIDWLRLTSESHVLNVASGSGGPSVRLARVTGCRVHGLDLDEAGIQNARRLAEESAMGPRVEFTQHDASTPLRFEDGTFDAVLCIDAINHLPDRQRTLAEWARVLQSGGRLLYTDPIIVTGPLTDAEIRVRSSIGFYLFVPLGVNEHMLEATGFDVVHVEDRTENMAAMARRWADARDARREELVRIEGEETYRGQQHFLEVSARVAEDRRLSRYIYVAEKTSEGTGRDPDH